MENINDFIHKNSSSRYNSIGSFRQKRKLVKQETEHYLNSESWSWFPASLSFCWRLELFKMNLEDMDLIVSQFEMRLKTQWKQILTWLNYKPSQFFISLLFYLH
jgi:hypothetical protein